MRTGSPIVLAVSLLLLVMFTGTVGYMQLEGWTASDALWMVVITLTTIGYGEVRPLSGPGRAFTVFLIMTGLSVGTYAMTQLTRILFEQNFMEMVRQRRRRRMTARLERHYIVIGFGCLGQVVVKELLDTGHKVCVLERDPSAVEEAERIPGVAVVLGEGADDACLRQARIGEAAGVAVTAAPVADAIFVTLSARQMNPQIPILTRVDSESSAVKARRAGATAVVSPYTMGGWRIAHGLVRPHATSFLDLATLAEHDDLLMDEIEVTADCRWCSGTIAELDIARQQKVLIVAIRRAQGEMEVTPNADSRLLAGDVLIVLGKPERVRIFRASMLAKGRK